MNNRFGSESIGGATRYTFSQLLEFRELFGGDITLNQLLVLLSVTLCYLSRRKCAHADLGKMTQLTKAAVSRAVTTLRQRKVVREVADAADARRRYVVPTDGFLASRRRFLERYFIEPAEDNK